MSLPVSPEKPARKAKKSKSKDAPVDASDAKERPNDTVPVASTSIAPLERKKKKQKSKSKAAEDDQVSLQPPSDQTNRTDVHTTTLDSEGSRKKRKKKRKHVEAEEDSGEAAIIVSPAAEDEDLKGDTSAVVERDKKSKKRKHSGDDGDVAEEIPKGDEVEEIAAEQVPRASDALKKSNKEKKRKRDSRAEGDTAAVEADDHLSAGALKKKKRKRAKTGFANPAEDESLSEQACKALQYAFNQFDDPGSWKFNKARQNWLVRHLWSQEAIPDTYMSLLTQYLAGVKGGAREALIKTCRNVLDEDASSLTDKNAGAESVTANAKLEQPSTIAADDTKRARAAVVLTVLADDSPS